MERNRYRALTAPSMLLLDSRMLKHETFTIANIYVPVKRRAILEQKRVDEICCEHARQGPRDPNPGAVRWSALCAGRGSAPTGGCQGAWREDHCWIPRRCAQALSY